MTALLVFVGFLAGIVAALGVSFLSSPCPSGLVSLPEYALDHGLDYDTVYRRVVRTGRLKPAIPASMALYRLADVERAVARRARPVREEPAQTASSHEQIVAATGNMVFTDVCHCKADHEKCAACRFCLRDLDNCLDPEWLSVWVDSPAVHDAKGRCSHYLGLVSADFDKHLLPKEN